MSGWLDLRARFVRSVPLETPAVPSVLLAAQGQVSQRHRSQRLRRRGMVSVVPLVAAVALAAIVGYVWNAPFPGGAGSDAQPLAGNTRVNQPSSVYDFIPLSNGAMLYVRYPKTLYYRNGDHSTVGAADELLLENVYATSGTARGDRVIVVTTERRVLYWDGLQPEVPPHELECRAGFVLAAQVSADGRWGAVADDEGSVRIYDLETRQLAREYLREFTGELRLRFHPDGNSLFVSDTISFSRCEVVGTPAVKLLHKHQASPCLTQVAIAPDGRRAVLVNLTREVTLVELETGSARRLPVDFGTTISCHDWSADSRQIYFGTLDGDLCLFDLASGDSLVQSRHTSTVARIQRSLDNAGILTTGHDGAILRWDPELTDEPVLLLKAGSLAESTTRHDDVN